MSRTQHYHEGYAAAWRDAVAFLHKRAASCNDPNAQHILNAAAHGLGLRRKQHTDMAQRDQGVQFRQVVFGEPE